MTESEINKAALDYATKMSKAPDKETPDWIITDFKAGVKWALSQLNKPKVRKRYSCWLDEMQCSETCHGNLENKENCHYCTVTILKDDE